MIYNIVKNFEVAMYLIDISENIIRKVVKAKTEKLFFLKLILFLFLIIKNPQNNVIMGKKIGL